MTDDRTISEIVDEVNRQDEPEDEEPGDEEAIENPVLDKVQPFMPMPATLEMALRSAPSVQQAREDAQIPPQVSVKDLENVPIVLVEKVKQNAFLPADGTTRAGWQCLGAYQETRKPFTVWIGQVALMRELAVLNLPFRTTITRRGRTYQFS